jgi:hypothetical protein
MSRGIPDLGEYTSFSSLSLWCPWLEHYHKKDLCKKDWEKIRKYLDTYYEVALWCNLYHCFADMDAPTISPLFTVRLETGCECYRYFHQITNIVFFGTPIRFHNFSALRIHQEESTMDGVKSFFLNYQTFPCVNRPGKEV